MSVTIAHTDANGLLNTEAGAAVTALIIDQAITSTDKTDLTDGGDTTLHHHDSDRDRANHTGTQAASTVTVALGESRTVTGLADYLANNADFNVKDYGADPDGTDADNTTAINAAITAAAAAGAGVVKIPPGIGYNLSDLSTDPVVDIVEESRAAPRRLRTPRPLLPGPASIEIIGHRGGATLAPENTMPAFSASVGVAHSAEWDVQVTSDGELVVMHDTTVDRTTDGTGDLGDMTLAEIRALDAGSWFDDRFAGTLVPTFAELLAYCGPRFRTLYPEIKNYRSTADIALFVQAIIDAGLEDRCVLSVFTRPADFPFVRAVSSRVTLGYTVNSLTTWNDEIDDAEADGNAVMLADYTILTASMVEDARSRGVDVGAWIVDTAEDIRAMAAIGVTRIITNMPRKVLP